jgi:hypothetical protein
VQPFDLFASRGGMTRTRSRTKARSFEGALLGGLLAATLSGCGGGADAGSPSQGILPAEASETSSATIAPLPTDDGVVEPGTYLVPSSTRSAVEFTITFPEGWRVREGNLFDTNSDQDDELSLEPFVVTKIYANACQGQNGAQTPVGPSVEDLVDALLAQPGPAKTTVETTLGGYPATRVDLRVPDRLQTKNCFGGPGTGVQIWLNGPKNYLVLDPDGLLSIYVVDVDGERAVFTSQYRPAHTSPEDKADLQQVLDSIQIEK